MKTLVVEGALGLWKQEGGFCQSDVTIGGKSLDVLIAEALGIEIGSRGAPDHDGPIGPCKLKLEMEQT
jgi:hypothetical protein